MQQFLYIERKCNVIVIHNDLRKYTIDDILFSIDTAEAKNSTKIIYQLYMRKKIILVKFRVKEIYKV